MIMAVFHRQGGELMLAACDSDIYGQCFEDELLKLDLGSGFYKGEEVTEEEFRGMLAQATSANLVGSRCVAIAIELEMVHPDAVLTICGQPHALFC